MKIEQLETPAALVDLDRLERNAHHMAERVQGMGAVLRPHVKTHKCAQIARLQVRGHAGGITVSTLAEARHFAQAGFTDITYAFPLALGRLQQVYDLARTVERFQILLDHADTARALETFARGRGFVPRVLIEIDCGDHRGGVAPTSEGLLELARFLHASDVLDLRGILTHAGQSYACTSTQAILDVARHERDVMVQCAARLRAEGILIHDVSIGSTPTIGHVDHLERITEVRPGNYAFYDRFQVNIGSCQPEDVAFSVLATVVGRYPERSRVVVDAGALALSKDRGAEHVQRHASYGTLADLHDQTPHPEFVLDALSQEHGQIAVPESTLATGAFPIGSLVRIQPNHSCLAAALFDRFHVVRGDAVVDVWEPCRGW